MRFRKPKQVEYQASEAGTVGVANMARILGITRQHLSDLACAGRVPTTIVRDARRYDVDRILGLAPRCSLPLPPLRRRAQYLEDTLWACEALGSGPWNLPTAPTGAAWRLYLDAKRDKVLRRRLTHFALKLAERDAFGGSRVVLGRNAVEQMEDNGKTAGSDDGEGSQPSAGELALLALEAMDAGMVDGPFPVDPDEEGDEHVRETYRPSTCQFPGAF